MLKINRKKLVGLALLISCSQLEAANWLNLQGMQPEVVAPKGVKVPYRSKTPKLWGFTQVNWKKDKTDDVFHTAKTGTLINPFGRLNPDLTGKEGFNVFRTRLALRGMADNENKVNYFFMTDFGNNGINNLNGHRENATYFTDASITVKTDVTKLRVGMFKTPSTEEGLQAVFVSPYVDFTQMANQQHLERKVTSMYTTAGPVGYSGVPSGPVGAYRDNGIQFFDTFDLGSGWDVSYAYMIGNGQGINMSSSNINETKYMYLAFEKSFGKGRGYYTESMKFFAWSQDGNRRIFDQDTNTSSDFNRKRSGIGATYYRGGLRLEAEYSKAEGMIFTGAKDTNNDINIEEWNIAFATGPDNTANGYYLNAQYELLPKKFEVFARYDVLDRLPDGGANQRIFTTTTVGASYRFKGATRVDFNYLMRSLEAPGDLSNVNAQNVANSMDDRIAIQFTAAF